MDDILEEVLKIVKRQKKKNNMRAESLNKNCYLEVGVDEVSQ